MHLNKIWCFAVLILVLAANTSPVASIASAQSLGWSDDIRLTFTETRSTMPAIAIEGSLVHVVWTEDGKGLNRYLWYLNSTDGGNSWNSPICLINTTPVKVSFPKIAVNGSNVHVIWCDSTDRRIHYTRSTDNGNTWDIKTIITPIVYIMVPNWDIGVYENYLHVVYADLNNTLCYIKSNDNGITWLQPIRPIPTSNVIFSAISVNGSNVHIAWDGVSPGNPPWDINHYIKSEDNGKTWGINMKITNPIINGTYYLDIDVYNDNIYVVYRANNVWQVFLSYSEDNGNNWIRNVKLSNSTSSIFRPAVTAKGKRIFVVWTDFRAGLGQIFIKDSNDGGKTWGKDTMLANLSSDFADIVANDNAAHVVWGDKRDGNEEVYYKRCSVPVPPIKASINIDPDTLNLNSKGRWITAYIELPNGYDVDGINISTILLEDTIPAEPHPTEIGDYDSDGVPDLMVKFDRSEVEDILIPSNYVNLTITGNLTDGMSFQGQDVIRAI